VIGCRVSGAVPGKFPDPGRQGAATAQFLWKTPVTAQIPQAFYETSSVFGSNNPNINATLRGSISSGAACCSPEQMW